MGYKEDIAIDFHRLHENWRDHSAKYLKWSEEWANKDTERDVHRRKLAMKIRESPDSFGLKANPSEAAIQNTIEIDETYIKLTNELHILASTKQAFEHRRAALDGLTKLFLGGYFAVPTMPIEVQKAIKDNISLEERGDRQKLLRRNPRLAQMKRNLFEENNYSEEKEEE